jgi:hypothetical protein
MISGGVRTAMTGPMTRPLMSQPSPLRTGGVRANSDQGLVPTLTPEDCANIYQKTIEALNTMEMPLKNLKLTPGSIAQRWNKVMLVLMLSRLDAIKKFFPGCSDQEAYMNLQKLSLSVRRHMSEGNQTLVDLDEKIWEFLLSHAFGKSLPEKMSVDVARKIALKLCNEVSEEEFATKLRSMTQGKGLEEKNDVLIQCLLEAQFKLFETFGYSDEEGFICVQKNLMDYAGDAVVLAYTSAYNYILLEIAEIDPRMASLPQPQA